MRRRLPSSGGFSIPADSGITPLPFGGDHGVCAKCEGRPAFFDVRRPADAAARRLCFECVFEVLEAAQPDESDTLEEEKRRLADTERTASPEELGRMAELLEEWWAAQEESTPTFVTEFIARHHASAPPPAIPLLGGRVAEGDMQSARLALLVMRGAVCERRAVAADRYLIEPNPLPVSREKAAELLARMPKPLDCHALVQGEVMSVRCRTIADPSHLRAREQEAAYWAEKGGYFPHLRREHGERYPELRILCLGCRESLVVSASDVERWQRDYHVHPLGTNASPPSFYLATNPEGARAAAAVGAAYLMKCYFGPNDWAAEEEGRVIELRDTPTWDHSVVYALAPDLGTACERCGERPAMWFATDTRTAPWRERRLCEFCTAAELAPHALAEAERFDRWVTGLSEKGRRSVADDVAGALERMEAWWKRLTAPPEVAAALERCRRL